MINNFSYFLYENNLTDYLNCYSTFLMTHKDLKNNILNHRMNFLINYYIQEKNSKMKKYKLIEYYIRSYKDDYLKKTIEYKTENENGNKNENKNKNENANKNENGNENKNENPNDEDEIELRDEDVEEHYKYMFINPPRKPEIDYDDIDRIYELKLEEEERLKEREKEILLENEYEDNYDNYDINENYEDYEYNTDDDYYEINEEYY